ncbi:MAG: serine/threonine protein kinase [Candidatus Krumholzibacteriota bacterium]|nr:serine/threonine protein kinase [Candidatus Krumholzibacteriota bacterium]
MAKIFNFQPGDSIAGKYEILSYLGGGWEGEVYKIRELNTRIERAAKIFFPKRNIRNRTATMYAKKLHKLRACPILIQYHTFETINYDDAPVTVFISEYVEGELLSTYLSWFRGKKLPLFQGIHLLHALTVGVESIHHLGEYHGDLHSDNVIVQRLGLTFDLKLLDLFHWGRANKDSRQDDICSIIRIFYDAIGGPKSYAKHPPWVHDICCGLKRSLIAQKFKTASELRIYLETEDWS